MSQQNELIHIALEPSAVLEASLIRSAAAILNKDLYETRFLLAGKIPKIIAHYDNMQIADSIVEGLKKLGLKAILLNDGELHQSPQIFQVQHMKITGEEIAFYDSMGRQKRVARNNAFLIIEGLGQTPVEQQATKQKTKFSLPRTLLMGGIPIWHKVEEKTTVQSIQEEYFLRLYGDNPAGSIIEVLQNHINYSFLGAELASSSTINFDKFVSKIRDLFPQAIFDDRLMKPSSATKYSDRAQENLEINCRLIYLFHLIF